MSVSSVLGRYAPLLCLVGIRPLVAQETVVRGTVRDAQGIPIASAEVQWLPDGTVVRTKEDGTYLLRDPRSGVVQLRVRRIGYMAAEHEVTVARGGSAVVNFDLDRATQQMAVLSVNARREPSDARLAGFRKRAEAQRGGHFITRDRIEQTGNRSLLDAFRGIPGIRFPASPRGNSGRQIRFRSNNCPPVVFIDGFAATATDFDFDAIDLVMVEGIELYASSSSVPPELIASRGLEQCGVVAIWSRPAQPRPLKTRDSEERRQLLRRELASGAVLTADQVDESAALTSGDLQVVYPEALWRSGVSGSATVEFVIDDRGRLDWGTVELVSASRPEFGRAMLEALAGTRWVAAKKGQKDVAELIVLTIDFARPNV